MNTGLKYLGKYELHEVLGRGGMAEVRKAFDTHLQRYVAIKLMHADLQHDPEFVKRFEREAQVIASLRHPHIVRLHDFQIADSADLERPIAYMVMEYIEGQTLTNYIRATSHVSKFPSSAEVIHLFSGLSSAIDYAHQHGMIHRDIKPANILLDQRRPSRFQMGEPILTDFGIVKLLGSSNSNTTLSGMWVGTPLYMSPEQAQGYAGNERSDIYSLGVILYEIYTGVQPFRGENPVSIIMQQISTMPISPELINPNIPPSLTQVILRSLAKNPEERFPGASAMTAALIEALKTPPAQSSLTNTMIEMNRAAHERSFPTPTLQNQLRVTQIDEPSTQLPMKHLPVPKSSLLAKKRGLHMLIISAILFLILASSGVGAFYLLSAQRSTNSAPALVGQAFFVSSGQGQEGNAQGIDDQLQIELHNIPDPAVGKSYYAWLLSDKGVSPQQSILLGRVSVHQGNVQFLYQGDVQHTNLLGITSRLLITEEDFARMPTKPSTNQSDWHYYAELPQTPDTQGVHKRIIDILRALLSNTVKLQSDWQGCIDVDFFTNVHKVLDLADSSRAAWQRSDVMTLHTQTVLILDYLDGLSLVGQDVSVGSAIQASTTLAQIPLIDIDENQEVSSYVDRINYDLTAIFNRDDATENMRQLAGQADNALLDNIKHWLEQVRQDARKLVIMTNTQLLLPSTLSIVNDVAIQATNAYNGHLDTSTSQMQEGATWLHSKDQQLATFDISPYAVSSTR